MGRKSSLLLAVAMAAAGCQQAPSDNGTTYTLYRNSLLEDVPQRVHVATFDVDENEEYNRENCLKAAGLFQSQPGVLVRYWCEKGRYRP